MSREDFVAVAVRLFAVYVAFWTLETFPNAMFLLSGADGELWPGLYIALLVFAALLCAFLWFFPLSITVPLFIVYAIVVCARTRIVKRKWLWLLFVAVGFFVLQLNWTTGAWTIRPIYFLLLGAGFTKAAPAAPLVLSVAFPLGAALFLARRRSLMRADDA